ncbi:MAG: hypothetical protein QOF21_856 [Actinomycetota bacterium]|jgi:hypothetical protein
METQAGERPDSRWVVLGPVAVAVVLLTAVIGGYALVQSRRTPSAPPIVDGVATKPISAAFIRHYDLRVPDGTSAYVVGSGEVADHDWFLVAHAGDTGACVQLAGYFANGGVACSGSLRSEPVQFLEGGGREGHVYEFGVTHLRVRTAVFLSDSGRSRSIRAVRPGAAPFRIWAAVDKRGLERAALAWTDSSPGVHPIVASTAELPSLCPNSESPLFGLPNEVPRAGSTTEKHVTAVMRSSTTELLDRFGATDVVVEPRNGGVWRNTSHGREVFPAGDYLLRLYLPSASKCPATPQSFDAVPLSFEVGPAPVKMVAPQKQTPP